MSGGLPVVGLHGAPRSGTTWIGQIVNSAPDAAFRFQPFFAHAFRPRADACRTPAELDALLDDIAASEDDFIHQRGEGRIARRALAFAKTEPRLMAYKEVRYHHLLPALMQIPRFRGVGIVRNPFDVLASWVSAPREFHPDWDFAAEWREAPSKNGGRVEEFYGYAGWKRAALIFRDMAEAHPDRFRILVYEELVRDPEGQARALLDFMGLPFGTQTAEFLDASTSGDDADPYGVFRSAPRRGGDPRITPEIRRWVLDDLKACGLAAYACDDEA